MGTWNRLKYEIRGNLLISKLKRRNERTEYLRLKWLWYILNDCNKWKVVNREVQKWYRQIQVSIPQICPTHRGINYLYTEPASTLRTPLKSTLCATLIKDVAATNSLKRINKRRAVCNQRSGHHKFLWILNQHWWKS